AKFASRFAGAIQAKFASRFAGAIQAKFASRFAGRKFFYVARNGIYHLFRALALRSDENVLVPDYHSGNETSAIRAAGAPIRFYPIGRDLQPDREAITRLCTPQTRALY